MTKPRKTFSLSGELNEAIALAASGVNMNHSLFLETRIRKLPEIQRVLEKVQNLPEDPVSLTESTIMPNQSGREEHQILS